MLDGPPFRKFDAQGLRRFLHGELCKTLRMNLVDSSNIEDLMWILKLKWLPCLA